MNTIDDFFHVGFTWDRHAEFMPRPIIIAAMEICTPEVVNFLLEFGADLSNEYEGTLFIYGVKLSYICCLIVNILQNIT